MAALGMASLGLHCTNKAIGMATMGLLCVALVAPPIEPTEPVKQPTAASVSGAVERPILQLYQPYKEPDYAAIIQEEDDELVSIVALLVSSGIIT